MVVGWWRAAFVKASLEVQETLSRRDCGSGIPDFDQADGRTSVSCIGRSKQIGATIERPRYQEIELHSLGGPLLWTLRAPGIVRQEVAPVRILAQRPNVRTSERNERGERLLRVRRAQERVWLRRLRSLWRTQRADLSLVFSLLVGLRTGGG